DQHELGELKRVVVSLLQNIDAMDSRTVLIAASNHQHLLDPAVWRRFAYKIELSLPDKHERKEMLRGFLDKYLDATDLDELAEASASMSGSQIRDVCNDAVRDAVLAGTAV